MMRRSATGTPFVFSEGLLNPDVEKLWELQSVLSQLGDREKQLTSKPESLAAIDREWTAANDEMTTEITVTVLDTSNELRIGTKNPFAPSSTW